MATSRTMDGNKLRSITVTGKKMSAQLADQCIKASFGTSNSQVTEMSLTFLDSMDLALFNSGILASGATVKYGDWNLTARVLSLASGTAGPEVTVKAPSMYVERLKGQTGAKSWGTVDVAAWVKTMAASAGMVATAQPGLGKRAIVRAKPEGQNRENSWDVLAAVATATGCWLFEYGPRLVMARPSWLVKTAWGGRTWNLFWNTWSDYSEGLQGMPAYTLDPTANPPETLKLRMVSPDADTCRPGDVVNLTGTHVGTMKGRWIVTGVQFPLTVGGVVTVDCQRPIDPVIPPEQTTTKAGTAGSTKKTATGTRAVGTGTGRNVAVTGVDSFVAKYNGVAIDTDGAFGAQCVDLVSKFNTEAVGGPALFGNGNQWFGNPAANGAYNKYAVGGANGETASKGDIACWGSFYGGGYGHVAVVLEDLGNSLRVFTQNPGPAHIDVLSKTGLQGYLRAKKWDNGPVTNTGAVKWY